MKKGLLYVLFFFLLLILAGVNYIIWYNTNDHIKVEPRSIHIFTECLGSNLQVEIISKNKINVKENLGFGIIYIEYFEKTPSSPRHLPINKEGNYFIEINDLVTGVGVIPYFLKENDSIICSQEKYLNLSK